MMFGWFWAIVERIVHKKNYMNGQQLIDSALKHIGEKYILGSLVPKNDPDYSGPWDCAEFTTWVIYQITGKLYGCANNNGNPSSADAYTGFWKRDADKIGTIVTVEYAARTQGAALLRYSGSGLIGHIVFSDGFGGTVEAHSAKAGVVNKLVTGRRWDIGILVPWIAYSQNGNTVVVSNPDEMIYRFTTPLMKAEKIKKIQKALTDAGFKATPDGIFGSRTFYAVKQFQNKMGLVADGEVGSKTLSALELFI